MSDSNGTTKEWEDFNTKFGGNFYEPRRKITIDDLKAAQEKIRNECIMRPPMPFIDIIDTIRPEMSGRYEWKGILQGDKIVIGEKLSNETT